MNSVRVLALWCPDWPAAAAAADADLEPSFPIAVTLANRVIACSATARAVGVRRGLRRREAQARCPRLHVSTADDARDARVFEPVIAAVTELVPLVEVLRPGLIALSARGAARYFGGEEQAAERLVEAVASVGVECQVGVADEMFAAAVAARRGVIVAPGESAQFLAPLPIAEIAAEPSLCADDRNDLVDLLRRLGLRRMGDFAALAGTDVATRFGADAITAHRQVRAVPDRPPSVAEHADDLDVEERCDPPIERVDAAAFAGRALAHQLHARLAAAGVACLRLEVQAITENGEHNSRIWRCAAPLTPEGTADRIRWQLDGWLTRGARDGDGPTAGVRTLRLHPVEVVSAAGLQSGLWGSEGESDERARRALVRVQGLLGGEAVRVGVSSGGRGPGEQITWIPLGDELAPQYDPHAPWPGRIPEPAPTVLLNDAGVMVRDAAGLGVRVTERGSFTSEPTELSWAGRTWPLQWWAGPWPIDERWWAAGEGHCGARTQVLLHDSRALLLLYQHQQWTVEGVYE